MTPDDGKPDERPAEPEHHRSAGEELEWIGAEVASPLGTALGELVLMRYLEGLSASP